MVASHIPLRYSVTEVLTDKTNRWLIPQTDSIHTSGKIFKQSALPLLWEELPSGTQETQGPTRDSLPTPRLANWCEAWGGDAILVCCAAVLGILWATLVMLEAPRGGPLLWSWGSVLWKTFPNLAHTLLLHLRYLLLCKTCIDSPWIIKLQICSCLRLRHTVSEHPDTVASTYFFHICPQFFSCPSPNCLCSWYFFFFLFFPS